MKRFFNCLLVASAIAPTTITAWDDPRVDELIAHFQAVDYASKFPPPESLSPEALEAALEEWKDHRDSTPQEKRCPRACSKIGSDVSEWAVYPNMDRLSFCNETMMFDMAVFNKIQDGQSKTMIRACTADFEKASSISRLAESEDLLIEDQAELEQEVEAPVRIVAQGSREASEKTADEILAASRQINNYLSYTPATNGGKPTFAFAGSGSSLMVLYVGQQARRQNVHQELLEKFLKQIQDGQLSERLVLELCDEDSAHGADYVVGIAATTQGDGPWIQEMAALWANSTCVYDGAGARTMATSDRITMNIPDVSEQRVNSTGSSRVTRDQQGVQHSKRAECRVRQVAGGDSCAALAAKCGITPAKFTEYNDYDSRLCSTLTPGQWVCCSSGDLPDMRPKPDDDGGCHVYTTKSGDTCDSMAAANSLKASDIETFNKKTWAWAGCKNIWEGIHICLSNGHPPLPAPFDDAQCGPVKPGTERPTDGTDLADLNPCLLNACCNIWGNCGVTDEFCTESESESGAPGTAAPGENGCVSNCGTDIVVGDAPSSYKRIGYFAAWNGERDCLNMRADQIPDSKDTYTHIHFSFPDITTDFKIDVSNMQEEFDRFKALEGVKKVIAIGGWAFSNEAATYNIFREAVKLENQATFRNNIYEFLEEHSLDGIDLDWEYPSAWDIPGTPPGSDLEADLLAIFLNLLKLLMPGDRSVSFAAPASFWYLRAYPIHILAPFVDYVVHMTYDLHGQWDHGNPWTNPGCPTGNCLRSHVNLTETFTALSMITKAGMPSNKVAVGITSYGRSFNMEESGCYTEMCKFTGDAQNSDAMPGMCTDTAGYISNAEIEVAREFDLTHVKFDALTDTIVYNDTQYVSYMGDENKAIRKTLYNLYNFAGTSDWAIDLQSFEHDLYYDDAYLSSPLSACTESYTTIDEVDEDSSNIPSHCLDGYIVGALARMLEDAIQEYDDIMEDGYDEKFEYFERAVVEQYHGSMSKLRENHLDEFFNCYLKQGDEWLDYDCPPYDGGPGLGRTIRLELKDEDELAKFLFDEYTIDIENIKYENVSTTPDTGGPGCNLGPCGLYLIQGWPSLIRDPEVPNPKDAISESLGNLRELPSFMKETERDINELHAVSVSSSSEDIVDGAMIPVFLIISAKDAMLEIAEVGEEMIEAERKFIIGMIVMAILFIIPGIGQAMSAITGIAAIARIALIAAEVGSAVYGAIDIAQDPDNAVVGIFGILLGFVGLGGAARGIWKDAATLRRAMTAKDLARLGDNVKGQVDLVDSLVKVCRART